MTPPLVGWSAVAPNLAEHADNPVHTDAGARAAGYPAAVVAGTTVYALMSHVPAAAWGLDWVAGGGCEVRFLDAVLADDAVELVVSESDDGDGVVEAMVGDRRCATLHVSRSARPAPSPDGEPLEPVAAVLDAALADYGRRAGDDLGLYDDHGVAHPAAWPCLANRIMREQLVRGPWIHTRSSIVHLAAAPRGGAAVARSTVIDRFETRAGKRAVIDVRIEVGGFPVCAIEHEAIVELSS